MAASINEQVVVITGASSGIGRETALQFAKTGAAVVLVARNKEALDHVAGIIQESGGRVLVVPADVGNFEQIVQVAKMTIDTFSRIDTWVNNAGVSLYATVEETTVEEIQQVMQTNFLGMVYGVNAVLPYMKRRKHGNIINIGSVESNRALPLQAAYAASKHAVKGYTEALRMEQQVAGNGINITLILPSAINTPLFNHARSKLGVKPMPVPPAYSPELVARSIVKASQSPQRDIYVGGAGFLLWIMQRISPALVDKLMTTGKLMFRMQTTNKPANQRDNLYAYLPGTGRIHGDFQALTKPSIYTPVFQLSPRWLRTIFVVAVPLSVLAFVYKKWKDA